MRGEFIGVWSELWREVWQPLLEELPARAVAPPAAPPGLIRIHSRAFNKDGSFLPCESLPIICVQPPP